MMGRVCIADHRPEHSLGDARWLNGCAQCEIERLRAAATSQWVWQEQRLNPDDAALLRQTLEALNEVQLHDSRNYNMKPLIAAIRERLGDGK